MSATGLRPVILSTPRHAAPAPENGAAFAVTRLVLSAFRSYRDLRLEVDPRPFKELTHNVAMQIAANAPEDVDELMGQAYIKDENQTIEELVKEAISKLGENIKIEEFARYQT